MKFKIKTRDIRRAMKKNGLEIIDHKYYKEILNFNYEREITCACPIGQLYTASHNNKKDRENAEKWGRKTFGKSYAIGFVDGFDGQAEDINSRYYTKLNNKYKEEYKTDFKNGQLLRKILINNNNNS